MDKTWDRKSIEVGGLWLLWLEWKKRMTMQNQQKSNAKKKEKKALFSKNLVKQVTLILR